MMRPLSLLLAALVVLPALSSTESTNAGANPVRKVVGLLQGLRKEVEAEGSKAKEIYEKFMCYCETTEKETTKTLEDTRAHVGSLESTIQELSGSNAQLDAELKDLKEDIAENKKAIEEATGVRKKEEGEFSSESADMVNSISALDKAIPALKKGLEAPSAAVLAEIAARLLAHSGASTPQSDRASML